MKEVKLHGNFYVRIYDKECEDEYLEMRKSTMIKRVPGFYPLRYQHMTDGTSILLLIEKTDESNEIPVGYAVLYCLDDREYQKAVSRFYGIEINAKYFMSVFVIDINYRRGGLGKLFMTYIIEEFCRNESLMMIPNEEEALSLHSVGFAFVGTDRKHGMRVN